MTPTHCTQPVPGFFDADVQDTQEYLRTAVRPGDPVTLKLLDQQPGEDRHGPLSRIYHGQQRRGADLGGVRAAARPHAASPAAWPPGPGRSTACTLSSSIQ